MDPLVALYMKKTDFTFRLMRSMILMRKSCEYVFYRIQALKLVHDDFIKDTTLNATLVEKFNWPKRYKYFEKTIEKLKKLKLDKVFGQAYQSDALVAIMVGSANNDLWQRKFSFSKMVGKIAKSAGTKTMKSTKHLDIQSAMHGSQTTTTQLKNPFGPGMSITQFIAEDLMKGKATKTRVLKFLNGKYDDQSSITEDLINYSQREPEPTPEEEAYCPKKRKSFEVEKTIRKMPKFKSPSSRVTC